MIDNLQDFLEYNSNKKIVAVQGLGFVGAVMSLVIANNDDDLYAVIGVDLPAKEAVIGQLNCGVFPIKTSDKKVAEFFSTARRRKNFYATSDQSAYKYADVVVVDVNLDVDKESDADKNLLNYNVNLNPFKEAIETIALNAKENVLVLVETTVPPGACEYIVRPIFQDFYRQRGLKPLFKIGHSYERVMPGPDYVDSIKNFYRVFSGIDEQSANATKEFLQTIINTHTFPLTRLKNTNASEMSKVLENSFRAMNIAFIQEWTEFAESAKVDLHEVIDAIRMRPTHKNMMKPGIGVGGYCLTKDPLLASWSSQNMFNGKALNQSEVAVKINDKMPLHTFQKVFDYYGGDLLGKSCLILGVSYLKNTGDTRYSPVETLYNKLKNCGAEISLHDYYVEYWGEQKIRIEQKLDFEKSYDFCVVGTPHDAYFESCIRKILNLNPSLVLFDPHGIVDANIKGSVNNKVITIGNGS